MTIWNQTIFGYSFHRIREKVIMAFVWRLPDWVMVWAAMRLWAHATSGKYDAPNPEKITMSEVLKKWGEK